MAPSKIPPAQGNGTEFLPTETTFGSLPWRGPLRAPQGPHPGRPALRTAMRNLVGEPRLSESRNFLTDGSSGSRLSRPSRNFRILTDGARRPAFSWWGQLPVRPRGPKSDNFRANPTHTSNFCVPPNTRVVICLPQVGRLTSVVKNMTSDGVAFAKWILLEKPQFAATTETRPRRVPLSRQGASRGAPCPPGASPLSFNPRYQIDLGSS